jgi:hypothetical protein
MTNSSKDLVNGALTDAVEVPLFCQYILNGSMDFFVVRVCLHKWAVTSVATQAAFPNRLTLPMYSLRSDAETAWKFALLI